MLLPTMSTTDQGDTVNVLYVNRQDAKAVKVALEKKGYLNKQFRMTTAQPSDNSLQDAETFIAIPITIECLDTEGSWTQYVVSKGKQYCSYSSSFFASHKNKQIHSDSSSSTSELTTHIQQALLSALIQCSPQQQVSEEVKIELVRRIQDLSIKTCPKKLEVIGDDRTLVIPRTAFRAEDDETFASLLALVGDSDESSFHHCFWKYFASAMGAPRVVRRGDIDPESSIRESGHRLLWPHSGQPEETGPGSPGWITITEQGISQSFDMTRVMFSRGNITEKIRFGKLVKEGETVLDMYAGIGYYTLPALVHGKATHVYACEWNEHAANALKYNLSANGVDDRATVLVGDCRKLARTHNLVNMFDRVSLGLLPSSEGGWRTAVNAVRRETGGCLHVHANVPHRELSNWKFWMCQALLNLIDERDDATLRSESNVVVCFEVERVKSYAPNIHHYVALVFVGPTSYLPVSVNMQGHRAGVLNEKEEFEPCPADVAPPSCALSPDGALHQAWMMENDS